MRILRPAQSRGHVDHGWLKTWHSFSFASYYDPDFTGFRNLRVINQDRVQPGKGFATHPHKNMEIITVVLKGVIAHKDSMGNTTQIKAGEIQRMTAGQGITHSEYNPSHEEELELLQIWILPQENGLTPDYEQKSFAPQHYQNTLKLIISPKGEEDSLHINQDVRIYRSQLHKEKSLTFTTNEQRFAWIQMISGLVEVNNQLLKPGDGLALGELKQIQFEARDFSDFLLFDLN